MCKCAEREKFSGVAAGRGMLEVDGVKFAGTRRKKKPVQAESSVRKAAECHENQVSAVCVCVTDLWVVRLSIRNANTSDDDQI